MNVAMIITKDGDLFKTKQNRTGIYNSVQAAKAAVKRHVSFINKRRKKPDRVHYDYYRVKEYELVEIEEHPV